MSKNILPYSFHWSQSHPHIAWADIYNNGLMTEIAVIALDQKNGDLYFIPIAALDSVDRERLIKIISKRDAQKYPLWDLMASSTLKNGMNALEYFNQLVKGRTLSGQIFAPNTGRMGAFTGSLSAKPDMVAGPVAPTAPAPQQEQSADSEQTEETATRRGPGRPPSTKK